jgi:hypothetical protein
MCRQVKCSTCGKATYAGCGMHVEQVLAGVPESQRCRCREQDGFSSESHDRSSRNTAIVRRR